MTTWRPGKPKPDNLEMIYDILPAIEADRTLEVYDQFIRFDWLTAAGKTPKLQLCLDRRHISKRQLSKPFGYMTISDPKQLYQLAFNSIVALLVHQRAITKGKFHGDHVITGLFEMMHQELRQAFEEVWERLKPKRQTTLF